MKKPFGITVLALLNAVFSIPVLIGACSLLMISGVKDVPKDADLFGFLGLLFSSLALAIAYGLWTLQDWGRKLEIATSYFGIALYAAQLARLVHFSQNWLSDFAYIVVAIASIAYCSMSSVKERFS